MSDVDYEAAGQDFRGMDIAKEDMQFFGPITDEKRLLELLGDDYLENDQYCSLCGDQPIIDYIVVENCNKKNMIMLICPKCQNGKNK